jgi:flagellar hook-length control protein FliK
VRLELNAGDWRGVDVDLVAGAHGLQVNVFAATAAARRVIQAQLTDLANALARRGLTAKQISVSVKRDNRRGSRQDDAQ